LPDASGTGGAAAEVRGGPRRIRRQAPPTTATASGRRVASLYRSRLRLPGTAPTP
jgi:hypothetical protein